ncbi:Major facilitator superfamily domain, general substrate transporter [Penicillium griseofulvum]|uniref:Major facilitator superfamily domain, general substrate transporter n=1 Tax=Penicillium patulum TaxID=5078 RepID=A0A135LFF9_PENPA|nr:Major facilitator superfamily domain, general substrate transporter [Penicillium griseofulvum]KXG47678.1 Major facilitator superfamily domain, general substrate transporter [Penicillium griseofulvum]
MSTSVEQSKPRDLHSENTSIIVDADAEKKLVRTIDLYLMPSIFILYLFSYMDRSNIGLAKIAGMEEDLHLTSHQYYTAVIVWVIGYTISAVPSKKNEQSKRFIIFLTAGILSGAFGGVISGAITSTLDGAYGIRGWRWLFIVEGVTTTGVSIIVHWTLLDYPHSSRGLSPEERILAQQRLIEDGIADQDDSKNQNISIFILLLQAISHWRTWILIPGYMAILGASAISYFYPTLINDMGYTATAAQYMTAPLYIASLAAAIPICWFADRNPHGRGRLLVGSMIVGMVFFAFTAGIRNSTARYLFLCFINMALWTGSALALSFTTTALASVTRDVRAIMLAWMSGVSALAQLYGSALFPAEDSPAYVVGFSVFAATFAVGAVCFGIADVLFKRYP